MKNFIKNHKTLFIVIFLIVIVLVILVFVPPPGGNKQLSQNKQETEEKDEFNPQIFKRNYEKTQEITIPKGMVPNFLAFPSLEWGDDGYYYYWLTKNSKKIEIDFSDLPDDLFDENDKDQIRYSASLGPNFADYYRLVNLSCGNLGQCQYFVVVDLLSGKAYYPKLSTNAGYDFRVESDLLILNPPEVLNNVCTESPDNALINCKETPSEYYLWMGDHFDFLGKYKISYDIKKVE